MGTCLAKEQLDFEGPVDFKHFEILRAIGKGAFGKVCIVKKRDTKQMYAMKYMNKVQIIEKRAVDNVFREILILKSLNHPFIVNLWFAFQDEEDIFLVLDLMLGGDLSYHLEKEGRFNVTRVRLYMAELCLALQYLAEEKIVHRDLKPANMLLDSKGHIHLTDFNVASIIRPGKTISSMTGTKPYMAPEVIRSSRSGYTTAVDWWSLGVSAYEMLRGERPYAIHHNMSNEEVYRILTKVRPPASARWDESTCNVLKLLLHPEPHKRLASLEQAKTHSFFQEIDWDKVYQLEVTPVYIPSQNRIHCDPTHELEEMIVEPNPLHKKKSRLSKRRNNEVGGVREDLEKINERFVNYNRLTCAVVPVASQEEEVHAFSETAASTQLSITEAQNDASVIRDTSLSLRKESITIHDNHKNAIDNVPEEKSPVASPIEVVVQVYENEEKGKDKTEEKAAEDTLPAPSEPQEQKETTEETPLPVEQEPAVLLPNDEETSEDKIEIQSVASTADPEITSEVLSSVGTPSNIYNPKDSDSMVPMHLLGSYNGSVDEGEIVALESNKGEGDNEAASDIGSLTNAISPTDHTHQNASPTEHIDENNGPTSKEIETSPPTTPPTLSDDSEMRTLLH